MTRRRHTKRDTDGVRAIVKAVAIALVTWLAAHGLIIWWRLGL